MGGSFVRRILSATITLASGTFNGSANTLTIPDPKQFDPGVRISCAIEKAGGIAMGTARIKIYGLRPSVMNQLTQLAFHPLQVPDNKIQVYEGSPAQLVFSGTILSSRPDYTGAPEVYLDVYAMTGYFNKLNPVAPTSYKGAADVAGAMSQLALQMGYSFENNGVQTTLSNTYQPGTALQQAQRIAQSAGIDMYLDDDTLAITPRGTARAGEIPIITRDTGLVGYPTFDKMGISLRCLYNRAIRWGGQVQIGSDVTPAVGTWRVVAVAHTLESETPQGQWFSDLWVTDNIVTVPP